MPQLPEWINLDRNSPSSIYHSPHSDHRARTIADYLAGVACVFLEAEVGHVGNTGIEWGSEGMECC